MTTLDPIQLKWLLKYLFDSGGVLFPFHRIYQIMVHYKNVEINRKTYTFVLLTIRQVRRHRAIQHSWRKKPPHQRYLILEKLCWKQIAYSYARVRKDETNKIPIRVHQDVRLLFHIHSEYIFKKALKDNNIGIKKSPLRYADGTAIILGKIDCKRGLGRRKYSWLKI